MRNTCVSVLYSISHTSKQRGNDGLDGGESFHESCYHWNTLQLSALRVVSYSARVSRAFTDELEVGMGIVENIAECEKAYS